MATCVLLDTEETSERTKTDKELPFIFKCRGMGGGGGGGGERNWENRLEDTKGAGRGGGGMRRKSTPNSISTIYIYIYCTVLIYILRFLTKEETCSKGQGVGCSQGSCSFMDLNVSLPSKRSGFEINVGERVETGGVGEGGDQ